MKKYLKGFIAATNFIYKDLDDSSRFYVFKMLIASIIVSIADVAGVILFGFAVTLAVASINFKEESPGANAILGLFNLESSSIEVQVSVISFFVIVLLTAKSFLSLRISSNLAIFFGTLGTRVSRNLLLSMLQSDLGTLSHLSKQHWISAVTKGINVAYMRVPFAVISIVTELILLLMIFISLLLINWTSSVITFFIFGVVTVFSTMWIQSQSKKLTDLDVSMEIETSHIISESVEGFEELHISANLENRVDGLAKLKIKQARAQAGMVVLPLKSKYVFEGTLIISVILVAGVLFWLYDAVTATSTFAIFVGAGMRVGPSMLRLQQSTLLIRNGWPYLGIMRSARNLLWHSSTRQRFSEWDPSASKEVLLSLRNVSVHFSNRGEVLKGVDFELKLGERVVIMGESGGGKSTLLKVIAGLVIPSTGFVSFNPEITEESKFQNYAYVGYVPQSVSVFRGTIKENILLGRGDLGNSHLMQVIIDSGLVEFVSELPRGLDTPLDELSERLSGGQKQRLGIARALYGSPRILLFDEITSALDAVNEKKIIDTIQALSLDYSVVMTTHKDLVAQKFERTLFMSKGVLSATHSLN